MPQPQKLRILHLLRILREHTDDENVISMEGILAKLRLHGFEANRKTIYDDIDALRIYGYDIIQQKGNNMGYAIVSRDFELPELKLLIDIVQSSRFITEKKSKQLIEKIEKFTSKHFGKRLRRQMYVADRVKTANEAIYYNVDILHNAIADGVQIAFKYNRYDINKKRQPQNDGADYIASPYCLTFSEENYYLVAHYPKHERLTHFRVDRMSMIRLLEDKSVAIAEIMGERFHLGTHLKNTFGMFGGKLERVSVRCENWLIDAVIDKFGEGVAVRKDGDTHFIATFSVNASPTFYAWVFTFMGAMKIISPDEIKGEFQKAIEVFIE